MFPGPRENSADIICHGHPTRSPTGNLLGGSPAKARDRACGFAVLDEPSQVLTVPSGPRHPGGGHFKRCSSCHSWGSPQRTAVSGLGSPGAATPGVGCNSQFSDSCGVKQASGLLALRGVPLCRNRLRHVSKHFWRGSSLGFCSAEPLMHFRILNGGGTGPWCPHPRGPGSPGPGQEAPQGLTWSGLPARPPDFWSSPC